MCFSSVNGAWPIQGAPSAPMCVKVAVSRSIQTAMKWQPMPAGARLPSGTRVEVLCGQPEQKYGCRIAVTRGFASSFSLESRKASRSRELRPEALGHAELLEALADRARDHRRRMLVVRRQQPRSGGLAFGAAPLAVVVELADHARAHVFAPVVELLLELVLDELALLLDHEDFLEALGEAPRALRLERPRHRDLVDAQADCAATSSSMPRSSSACSTSR